MKNRLTREIYFNLSQVNAQTSKPLSNMPDSSTAMVCFTKLRCHPWASHPALLIPFTIVWIYVNLIAYIRIFPSGKHIPVILPHNASILQQQTRYISKIGQTIDVTPNVTTICQSGGSDFPFMVAIVDSHVKHFGKRRTIRQTWANKRYRRRLRLVTIFVVGQPKAQTSDADVRLLEEIARYEDVMQLTLEDNGLIGAQKTLAALDWIAKNCLNEETAFILKTKDDLYLNLFLLQEFVRQEMFAGDGENLILCHMEPVKHDVTINIKNNSEAQDYLARKFGDTLPAHCQGSTFVLTRDLIVPLLKSSTYLNFDLTGLEDVFLTGVVPALLPHNVTYIDWTHKYVSLPETLQSVHEPKIKGTDNLLLAKLYSADMLQKLWMDLALLHSQLQKPDN